MYHCFNLKKTATPAYLFDEIPVKRNFHIAYDVLFSTSQFIELSALQVLTFKMFSRNGIYWIQISVILTRLRSSRANY